MGRREKKTGKGRLDKYYKLAKEQGYRARSAFKLIQLDKKYNFLSNARCVIDLCAAPGGWLQVAAKNMKPNSLIIGVDLVPIKPIGNVITFAQDITSNECRQRLRAEMKDWKADVIMHDGAPNVGQAWIQDAFTQAQLVLSSLKLATEFLTPGGTFVTKCFRSKDYNSLLWVFNQLFKKVEATKPPSSRNVSAEIFVVCSEYLAPRKIDPKLLSHHHVFEELDAVPTKKLNEDGEEEETNDDLLPVMTNILHPEKKTRKRQGYADGDYTLFHESSASDFIKTKDPLSTLSKYNQVSFKTDEDKELLKFKQTTEEVVECLKDLKVLGRKEFKFILKWRIHMRKLMGLEDLKEDEKDQDEIDKEEEPLNEEEQIEADLEKAALDEKRKRKKEKRKKNEKKAKEIQRLQLKMVNPGSTGPDRNDELANLNDWEMLSSSSSEGEDNEEDEKEDVDSDEEVDVITTDDEDDTSDGNEASDLGSDEGTSDEGEDNEDGVFHEDVIVPLKGRKRKRAAEQLQLQQQQRQEAESSKQDLLKQRETTQWFGQSVFEGFTSFGKDDEDSDEDSDEEDGENEEKEEEEEDDNDEEEVAPTKAKKSKKSYDPSSLDEQLVKSKKSSKKPLDTFLDSDNDEDVNGLEKEDDFKLTTAEAMTLAHSLVNREKTKEQLIDEGFHRNVFDEKDGLPTWFLDDETKVTRRHIPITKEVSEALKAKTRELNARPIKKIAEAKARKKMRTLRRLTNMQKKADLINEGDDLTEREKAQSIQKLMAKARKEPASKSKKNEIKMVVAKGPNRGIKGRPMGTKGRYKMVDPRMKKELKAAKRKVKAAKGKGKSRR